VILVAAAAGAVGNLIVIVIQIAWMGAARGH
jgi:NADPH-dependent curcumin reductase CurA